MAITALSKQVEGQHWTLSAKTHINDTIYDAYVKSEMGTLILSDMADRNYRRLTLSGAIAAKTLFKQMIAVFRGYDNPSAANMIRIGANYLGDPLCHFDFSDEDIRSGKKYIEYQIVVTDKDDMLFGLYCRDCESRKVRRYMFSNPDDIYSFVMELGIKEAVIRNGDGRKVNTISVEDIKNPVSNLFSLLMIHTAAHIED